MTSEGREILLDVLWGVGKPKEEIPYLPRVKVLTIPEYGEDLREVIISVRQQDRKTLLGVLQTAGIYEDPRMSRPKHPIPWLRIHGGKPMKPIGFDNIVFWDANANI